MNRVTAKLLFLSCFLLFSSKSVFALDPYATGSAVVSATVVSTQFDPPILISPDNNAITTNRRVPLVWERPSTLPATPLHHYDLFLDGQLFAASISDSITTQSYYFYTIYRNNDTFYLDLSTDLSEGYHTWSVTAYDTSGVSSSSETRTFYLDSSVPYIVLQTVDRQTLNWDTNNLTSIPDINLRDIRITSANPLLTGTIEPYANMQIILLCPQNILNCQSQTYQGNYPTGIWQHRFYGLIRGLIYTVHLSATDASGNSVIFPEFYLAYDIQYPTKATVSPTVSITPSKVTLPSVTLTPIQPSPEIIVPPTAFIPVPPISPTPPLIATLTPQKKIFTPTTLFMILLVLGLPLHLFMTTYGAKIHISHVPKFLFILFFPFLGKNKYQTTPFASLYFYDPENLNSPWQTKISNINGFYNLPSKLIPSIFVKIICTKRDWKNTIISSLLLSQTCLFPRPKDTTDHSDNIQSTLMRTRSLPLIVAIITSATALYSQPKYFYLIYLYLSVHLFFSEYLHPKTSD